MNLFFNRSNYSLILSITSLLSFSCSSEKEKNNITNDLQDIRIRTVRYRDGEITNVNHDDSGLVSDKLTASGKRIGRSGSVEEALFIEKGDEFDFTSTIQINEPIAKEATKASQSNSETFRDVAMDKSKRFRFILIEDGQRKPVYNRDLKVDENPSFRISIGTKYLWYAFSRNNNERVPDIDVNGNVSSDLVENTDFMYASGAFVGRSEENYLDITFLRQMAAIDLTLNTRGVFGGITDQSSFTIGIGNTSSFTTLIQTGTFNIFEGTFHNLRSAKALQAINMTAVDKRWENAEKTGRFFTANTAAKIAANSLSIRLNTLSIVLDDKSVRTFSANTVVPIAHSTPLNLTKGTLSRTGLRLIESGITVDGLVWARTNMIYDNNKLYGSIYSQGNSDAYRFRPNNNYAYADVAQEYWNFASTTPTGTDYQSLDPCSRVFPEGTWRLPQEQNNPKEITLLSRNTKRTTSITKVSDGFRYSMIWPGTQATNPAYPDKDLILSAYGYRDSKGVVQQIPSNGKVKAGNLIYRSNAFVVGSKTTHTFFLEILGDKFGKTSVTGRAYSEGVPIRCVRNVLNN